MANNKHMQALDWLYRNLKKKRMALSYAEKKPNVLTDEIDSIKSDIEAIEYIIGVVVSEGGE